MGGSQLRSYYNKMEGPNVITVRITVRNVRTFRIEGYVKRYEDVTSYRQNSSGKILDKCANRRRSRTMELMYQILSNENMKEAVKRVKANKGASGIDKITVKELDEYMQENFARIKEEIWQKKYKPQAVRRVYILKANGKLRPLGIPVVMIFLLLSQYLNVFSFIPFSRTYFINEKFGYFFFVFQEFIYQFFFLIVIIFLCIMMAYLQCSSSGFEFFLLSLLSHFGWAFGMHILFTAYTTLGDDSRG